MDNKKGVFSRFAEGVARQSGRPLTFALAAGLIIAWALTGPIFDYNDTWQLVINTSTTIITFLMVFVIQNTQNRDNEAVHLKLDELIKTHKKAHNQFMDLEELEEEELDKIKKNFENLATKARKATRKDAEKTNRS